MDNRLFRSKQDRILGGVAGGLARYLGTDPALVRIGWVVLALAGGTGLLLYVLAWIIIPEAPNETTDDELPQGGESEGPAIGGEESDLKPALTAEEAAKRQEFYERRRRLAGGALIILGAVFLINEFAPFVIDSDVILPLGLILVGFLILRRRD